MKIQKSFYLFYLMAILGSFISGCTESLTSKGDDPTLFAFLANNGAAPDPTQSVCLSNLFLMNSCVGGTAKGQGFSGSICGANTGGGEEVLRDALSTPYANGCILKAIEETECNLPTEKSVNFVEALEGPFADLFTCIEEAIAEAQQATTTSPATP